MNKLYVLKKGLSAVLILEESPEKALKALKKYEDEAGERRLSIGATPEDFKLVSDKKKGVLAYSYFAS